ncbi:sialate O-acetylesterase [Sphingobacterium griseoflavum]|uniref:9-O-acetylesterase n=1 Tax=Sphingobacterium griseoflavum TaxID=1474952 RepID=A0ABQ3HY75_9SPHI|nr:sialate O-acetylesterase [Sphingobacterium griseoflavum]GHE35757.1 9-O-acetylesterase [Sphingobacterium griseoflavum]
MKYTYFAHFIAVILLLFFKDVCASPSSLKLSSMLQSKMVVQQNRPIRVWGEAAKGAMVSVKADWLTTPVIVQADDQGAFLAILDVPSVQGDPFAAHWLRVESGGEHIQLDSLLIGDVWLCSGQSNMQFSLQEDYDAAQGIAKADRPEIRLFNASLNFSDSPLDSLGGTWEICSPEFAKKFSAAGFYLASRLSDSLRYPIGVIFSGIGASAAQAYVPKWELANNPVLNKQYLEPYLSSSRSKEVIDGSFSFEKVTRPYLLYNAMIHPLRHLAIKGICWYQGESNHEEREHFSLLMESLVRTWRTSFRQGELPFYFIQIAPYGHEGKDKSNRVDAFFREAQQKLCALNNVEMVVSMDVGDANDLHPKRKRLLGERLADIALNRLYGHRDQTYRGPTYNFVQFNKGKAIVNYTPTGLEGGLKTNDGSVPAYFELAGEDRVFHAATAKITGNSVEVSSKKVSKPVALRYAFTNDAVTNLENGAGFPAVPFRTDQWQEVTIKDN